MPIEYEDVTVDDMKKYYNRELVAEINKVLTKDAPRVAVEVYVTLAGMLGGILALESNKTGADADADMSMLKLMGALMISAFFDMKYKDHPRGQPN